ncbi:P1 family peptidase [Polaromonas jejuensis]|uniref:P1 family peptidase n=1 Tax=Polaromonas jejuensis TaxID=457502 RepID=A0ABW0QCE7_9BURK|nr:P1 family peptidase [Polaromonas jejuensis]
MPNKPRARDLGIPFDGTPGPLNAITDVAGVAVGHTTLIEGSAVRTGVTAILPAGQEGAHARLPGACFSLNGNGEMTGSHWLEESGLLEGPVMLTNTHSVGVVRDATVAWLHQNAPPGGGSRFYLPVVAETYDGVLSDINGQHVRAEHAHAALDQARTGPVAEGCVGGGTGMITHKWKAGIGTSSRQVTVLGQAYTVGVLVQSNYGERQQLTIAGVPVGREITHSLPGVQASKDGSIIACIATDAPLLPHQCKRLARRACMGLARVGSVAMHSSGDIFLAFSTQQPADTADGLSVWQALPHGSAIDPLFQATVEAMEEAIVNAMLAADTMTGLNGTVVHALPHDELRAVLARHGRLKR